MILVAESKLIKIKAKNTGNTLLCKAIDQLILDIKTASWKKKSDLIVSRPDADCVHSDGFFFFDISIHRTLVFIQFDPHETEANIVWVGTHEEYETTFKNNKKTINKWLRIRGYIK